MKISKNYISVVLVGKATTPLWYWEKWSLIASSLNPIMHSLKTKIALRTTQDFGISKYRLGTLAWDQKSHEKWTHFSPLTNQFSKNWQFMEGEIWSPSWTDFKKKQIEPDIFISFQNPFILAQPKLNQFNQFFHIAESIDLLKNNFQILIQSIEVISQTIDTVLSVINFSDWIVDGHSIQDTLTNYMNYLDMENDMIPDLSKLPFKWSIFNSDIIISYAKK